jgi:hypothetical protein
MEEMMRNEQFILNVYRNGELDDVIEGAAAIRKFIKDKKDGQRKGMKEDDVVIPFKGPFSNDDIGESNDRWGA